MTTFDVTYDIVTPESAEHGDAEERGFICKGVSLRDAVQAVLETRTSHVDGITAIEADEHPMRCPRITVYNGMEYFTGANEARYLHLPEHLTASTRRRIARLVGM